MATEFATAFIETVVRDRLERRHNRTIKVKEVTEQVLTTLSTKPKVALKLLDLRGSGCTRIGAPTDTVNARNHAAGRAFSKCIHMEHPEVDGIIHASRLTGKDVYAIFDRAVGKLDSTPTRPLEDHPDLPEIFQEYGINLILQTYHT